MERNRRVDRHTLRKYLEAAGAVGMEPATPMTSEVWEVWMRATFPASAGEGPDGAVRDGGGRHPDGGNSAL